MVDKINQLEEDIRNLTIQGATNVALATLEGISLAGQTDGSKQKKNTGEYLLNVGRRLAYARPTEPLAQNSLRFIFQQKDQSLSDYQARIEEYKQMMSLAKEKMADAALPLIENGGVYLTHCHSSTVTSIFKKAREQGKRFAVYATETRPRYQGRITVKELLEAGLEDVTLIIDDVAESLLQGRIGHIDAVFIGADLLGQKGFVNKVGSLGIAYTAQSRKIPLYCLSVLLKYDPQPFNPAILEQRGGFEVWPDAPKNLKFYAPAFDFVPYAPNVQIVCEKGKIDSVKITEEAYVFYPFLKEEK